ncbi:hypothetical protein [Arcobacter aquimarinus]|uniref:DNA-deoxyinosine glycosylase n=1 Tax=Arcobacter aquimarinus TaxID=1315211 RepID=A0AAE7E2U2_9BACT|nr:hypothetical protein [Arcobacter aquimarinus]QKE27011.1 hypothetical protein AAQM_2312 [Arcobacter aquimarinus]RXI36922.1 hypothetical protein CP986_00280 [Arcobacter aquimarinus]
MIVKHKFYDECVKKFLDNEILIIGTFNPNIQNNEANFFYGRNRNYFWKILPELWNEESLKGKDINIKKNFLEDKKIAITDLILCIEMKESQINSFKDDNISNVKKWNTDNIIDNLKCSNIKKIFFTRKSFNKSTNFLKMEICKIKSYCESNFIKFEFLPTPSRYANEKKIKEWKELIFNDNTIKKLF